MTVGSVVDVIGPATVVPVGGSPISRSTPGTPVCEPVKAQVSLPDPDFLDSVGFCSTEVMWANCWTAFAPFVSLLTSQDVPSSLICEC